MFVQPLKYRKAERPACRFVFAGNRETAGHLQSTHT